MCCFTTQCNILTVFFVCVFIVYTSVRIVSFYFLPHAAVEASQGGGVSVSSTSGQKQASQQKERGAVAETTPS